MTDFEYQKTDTVLKLENISLTLGDNKILRDINLDIKDIERPDVCQGQIISLLAKSGTGKTQLFKIIAGLQKPDTGDVWIRGKEMKHVELGEVGVVQQSYPLFKDLTVHQNLKLAANFLPKSEQEDKINMYLDHFSLSDKKHLYPAQLSGGMRQRVAIAQQMICARHYLLMDEPFSGLDPTSIDKVSEMIVEVANINELNTIFIVSHDINSTCAISDTVLLLGKDKDEEGNWIPGAYIKKEYDLIEANLAWHKDIRAMPDFAKFTSQIREEFKTLA